MSRLTRMRTRLPASCRLLRLRAASIIAWRDFCTCASPASCRLLKLASRLRPRSLFLISSFLVSWRLSVGNLMKDRPTEADDIDVFGCPAWPGHTWSAPVLNWLIVLICLMIALSADRAVGCGGHSLSPVADHGWGSCAPGSMRVAREWCNAGIRLVWGDRTQSIDCPGCPAKGDGRGCRDCAGWAGAEPVP